MHIVHISFHLEHTHFPDVLGKRRKKLIKKKFLDKNLKKTFFFLLLGANIEGGDE